MQDMQALKSGEIIPGEGIGSFRLGTAWAELRGVLVGAYSIQQRRGCFAVRTATLWFIVDEVTQAVTQITALGRFQGRVAGQIGIGSTLTDVARQLGAWSESEDDGVVVETCPGICFELGFVPGRDLEWQLQHAPIEFISVFRDRVAD